MANELYDNEFYDKAARAAVSSLLVSKKANVCPFAVRLAWHASGTYDANQAGQIDEGGSDGATMRFEPEISDGANAGLSIMMDVLKPLRTKFPDLSIADVWTMAATQAIHLTGGPVIPYRYGRTDAPDGTSCPAHGRLPAATEGASHLRDIFYRMGFDDKAIVALSGAHTLGSCHRRRSGFDGPWTRHPLQFDNEYYKNLLELTWTLREWDGPLQYTDPSGTLMMLPTDLALIQDEKFLPYVQAYAADEALFFRDFSEAFGALLAKGCPDHVVPQPATTTTESTTPSTEQPSPKDPASLFRDLAMHGSLERMKELYGENGNELNVNAVEAHSHRTALHKAAYFGHAHVVEYLCGNNNFGGGVLQVNAVDGDGDTALHDAARFGHEAVVKILLDMGQADPTIRNLDGRTALDMAVANDKTAVVELLLVSSSKAKTSSIEL